VKKMLNELIRVKEEANKFSGVSTSIKNAVLTDIVKLIDIKTDLILDANKKDLELAHSQNLASPLIDRLTLNKSRLVDIVGCLENIIKLDDPVMKVEKGYKRPNGLEILKVRVPIGVICIIYESRPNVTVDTAALCIKSGNAVVLRGGKEAVNTNKAFVKIIKEALINNKISEEIVCYIDDPERTYIYDLLKAKGLIDLIIPRGGSSLINFVEENSLIPIVKHDKGVCHVYVDKYADIKKAINIIYNAKVQRPSVCNAMETLLIHSSIGRAGIEEILKSLSQAGVKCVGCELMHKYYGLEKALEEDWYTEYLDLKLSIKIVEDISKAIEHINKYGSHHSDSIITENYSNAALFVGSIDSAVVYVNASTRFTDGYEFGLGAEVGISTQKLHCRGPMGLEDLTTYKYIVFGNGQVRS
jgi:glutamate-5-semialdehyde dehydrogenase